MTRGEVEREEESSLESEKEQAVPPPYSPTPTPAPTPMTTSNRINGAIPKKMSATVNENDASAYVLREIKHWEQRIGKFDQRHVNVVAAALDPHGSTWKAGQIVEVVPSSLPGASSSDGFDDLDHEILYIV